MTRPLHSSTKAVINGEILPLAVILRLEIEGDPLYCWSGYGNLTFAVAETGDPSLDGTTFIGSGDIIDLSSITEGVGGSDALEISMPGASLDEPLLRQLIRDRRRWQFKRAVVWLVALDPVTLEIAGKPFRIKTGRIDQMPYSEDNRSGEVRCKIEGQNAYGNIPLGSRYSEQFDLDVRDTSQKFVHSLANMSATIGKKSYPNGVGSTSTGGRQVGSGGSFGSRFIRQALKAY